MGREIKDFTILETIYLVDILKTVIAKNKKIQIDNTKSILTRLSNDRVTLKNYLRYKNNPDKRPTKAEKTKAKIFIVNLLYNKLYRDSVERDRVVLRKLRRKIELKKKARKGRKEYKIDLHEDTVKTLDRYKKKNKLKTRGEVVEWLVVQRSLS